MGRGSFSRRQSALQAALDIGSGFIVSWLVWIFIVAPLFDYETSAGQAVHITLIFTVASLIRAYGWRRFWEWRRN